MTQRRLILMLLLGSTLAALLPAASVFAEGRFPPPDFTTGYTTPNPDQPHPESTWMAWVDMALLVGFLGMATFIALKWRSRNAMLGLTIAAVAYFGFYRKGCVCPIGSIQNVSLALFDSSYVIPLSVLVFFLAPLVFALFVGRVFCGGVCPLGAIQDLVLVKPIRIPRAVDHALGIVPYLYLSAAVLFAATGTMFIICKFDPFVGFFRLSASLGMVIFGGILLLMGMFIGRPYCRFLCPYGAVLRQFSRLSGKHLTITPNECIKCELCAESCPFNAIDEPAPASEPTAGARARIGLALVAIPLLAAAMGGLGWLAAPHLARVNESVMEAEAFLARQTPLGPGEVDKANATLAAANAVTGQFQWGMLLVGGFFGAIIGSRMVRLSRLTGSSDYTANQADCVSCARCVARCPKTHEARGPAPLVPLYVAGQLAPAKAATKGATA